MKRRKDFKAMCDRLEKNSCSKMCEKNEIKCARKEVMKYIGKDKDNFLKLKAEAEDSQDIVSFYNLSLTIINFVIIGLSFILNVYGTKQMGVVALIAFIIFLMIATKMMSNHDSVNKWRKYILIVLEEYEK